MLDFVHDDGTTNMADDVLLIFIDETGQENLQDQNFPIFGFAGCMCVARDYANLIDTPWREVQKRFPTDIPLHAADLRPEDTTREQLDALNTFFTDNAFGRFAAIISDKAVYQVPVPIFHALAVVTYKRICEVASMMNFDEVVMIFEASERTDKLMSSYFSRYDFEINGVKLATQRFRATKTANISGLMVADFIAHSAGSSVHNRIKNGKTSNNTRKDMKAIFEFKDSKITSFIEISGIKQKQ
jgi:hypothetical protein